MGMEGTHGCLSCCPLSRALPLHSSPGPSLSSFPSSLPTPQVKECPPEFCAGQMTLFDLCQWFLFKLSTLLPSGHASGFLPGPTDLAGVQGSFHHNGPPLPSGPASIL